MSEVLNGPERILVAPGEESRKQQLAIDKIQRVAWIHSLCDWEVMATFTFVNVMSLDAARRAYESYMRKGDRNRVSYYYALERNPSRDGYHVHALWGDCAGLWRKRSWEDWFRRFKRVSENTGREEGARARIEPCRSVKDSEDYASKYLCKWDCWWNVRLQWHRHQTIRGGRFTLESSSVGGAAGSRDSLPETDPSPVRSISQVWASHA